MLPVVSNAISTSALAGTIPGTSADFDSVACPPGRSVNVALLGMSVAVLVAATISVAKTTIVAPAPRANL